MLVNRPQAKGYKSSIARIQKSLPVASYKYNFFLTINRRDGLGREDSFEPFKKKNEQLPTLT